MASNNYNGTILKIEGSYYHVRLENDTIISNAKNFSSLKLNIGIKVIVTYTDSFEHPIITNVYNKTCLEISDEENLLKKLLETVYPVGSYHWSDKKIDPSELFGIGTWERVVNTFLYAINDNETPGIKKTTSTVALGINNMPSHNHGGSSSGVSLTTNSESHTHNLGYNMDAGSGTNRQRPYNLSSSQSSSTSPVGSSSHSHSINSHSHTITIGSTGSGESFDIMPPHRGAYCWRRIL